MKIIDSLEYFIVENEKTARAFIKRLLPEKIQRDINMEILDKHTDPLDLPGFLKPVERGENVGIISEAGVPVLPILEQRSSVLHIVKDFPSNL